MICSTENHCRLAYLPVPVAGFVSLPDTVVAVLRMERSESVSRREDDWQRKIVPCEDDVVTWRIQSTGSKWRRMKRKEVDDAG